MLKTRSITEIGDSGQGDQIDEKYFPSGEKILSLYFRNSCFYQDSEPTASTVVWGESTVSTATSPVESIASGEPTVPGEPKASVAVEAGQAVKVVPAGQAIERVNQAEFILFEIKIWLVLIS